MKKSILVSISLLFSFAIIAQVIDKPRGCFAGTNGTNPNVLAHPEARGVLLSYKWHEIEVSPGVFDFTALNSNILSITNAGLKYSLAILGGALGSPDWLTDTLGATYHNIVFQDNNMRLPLWWDPIVENRLNVLITEIGNQYANDSMLSHIYVTQMTTNGVEGHLNGVDMNSFASSGFTAKKWISSAKSTVNKYAQAFPDIPIVFEVHEIDNDTLIPSTIINDLYNDPALCKRVGIGMWWISGKTSYQPNLIDYIFNFQGDKYAQIIKRSDQVDKFKDSLYSTVFDQAKYLGIRYLEPWPYEFQYHTHDSLIQDFNMWADANFLSSDTCSILSLTKDIEFPNNEVVIFPNPTNGLLKFQIDFSYQKLEILLFSLNGQLLLNCSNQTELDISQFPEGTYIVEINIDNKISQKKVIKLE